MLEYSTSITAVFIPTVVAFIIGLFGAPLLTRWLYKKQMWKKKSVTYSLDGHSTPISQKLHNDNERKVPRMGGIVVWGSVSVAALLLVIVGVATGNPILYKIGFISRSQTWLPFAVLIIMSVVGLIDDYLVCRDKGTYVGGGLSLRTRVLAVLLVGAFAAFWFYVKLGHDSIIIPFYGDLYIGWLFVPLFLFAMIGTYAGSVIDGIDGLAGGVLSVIFVAYAVIAFSNHQIDLAGFSMAIVGGLLAFLWYNIQPARFFLSETGTMGLTTVLVVIAFLSKAEAVLPIIALPLMVSALSSLVQILSKKFRNGKKVFIVAPLHNHFQAMGWPAYKVTMRYWIISVACALVGVTLVLLG